jgi:AraC-like DNA-binding protein
MDTRIAFITRVIAEQNVERQLSARSAASLLEMSEGHFLRLFRREVGTTFRRYRRTARISAVAVMLAKRAASIKAVAQTAGYQDISNFHRDFVLVHGMTPRKWQLKEFGKQFPYHHNSESDGSL